MYKFVKCMAVCFCAMAIAACQKALARDLVFTANILSSSDNKAVGIYDFTPSGTTLTAVPRFTGPTINGNGGGVVSDDVYHYIRWTEAIGFIFPYYHAVSLEDGSQVAYSESIHSNDQSYFATDLAYNARDGKIYGVFYNSDRTGAGVPQSLWPSIPPVISTVSAPTATSTMSAGRTLPCQKSALPE